MHDLLNKLFYTAEHQHASDLHIVSGQSPLLRIHGQLCPINQSNVLSNEDIYQMLQSTLTEQQVTEFNNNHELDFAIDFNENNRFRANAFQTRNGISVAFRRIENNIRTIDELGFPPIFKSLCSLHKGLILITGPTGSGKSTTMASMIDYINSHYPKHIVTIEDPIEYVHKSKKSLVNQREIHKHCSSFSGALRGALREDPDVILVGELRDLDTISLALTAAETGHLVFATLHTSSAPKAIDRIIDIYPEGNKPLARTMLSSSLQGIITQFLAPRADNKGRVPVLEILIANPAIRNLIRENQIAQISSTMEVNKKSGMVLLSDSIEHLLSKRIISVEQARSLLNEVNLEHTIASLEATQAEQEKPKQEVNRRLQSPPPAQSSYHTNIAIHDSEQF